MRQLQASWSAIAGAAVTALTKLYPSQAEEIRTVFLANFERVHLRSDTGFEYGRRIALYYLCLRCDDGSRTEVTRHGSSKVCALAPEPQEDTAFLPFPDPPYDVFEHSPDPVKAAAEPGPQAVYVPFWGGVRCQLRLMAQTCSPLPCP